MTLSIGSRLPQSLHLGAGGQEDVVRQAILPHSMCAGKVRFQPGTYSSPSRRVQEHTGFLLQASPPSFVRGWSRHLFINLIDISNKESHKATAYQCHCRGGDHHHDDTPGHVDEEAQTNSNQDLSQLHHGGEGSTVHAFTSATVVGDSWGSPLLLQETHRDRCWSTRHCHRGVKSQLPFPGKSPVVSTFVFHGMLVGTDFELTNQEQFHVRTNYIPMQPY